ncbi:MULTISPECIES: LPS export ABC transporter periplasmic protein LptC [Dictyoglomus]|jgi:lipopolysaccharide assembly outer membrane protein LptD (OstA)|uniref:OstA family protein n=1 Tax=Dictyoglomus turgidum (strain DSM 6724 / Z-1310) TaxID=515635 RepID=B8DYU8_DICTD|nr:MULTISPECIES: LPS export ABC transporter periplasmic protein LptC [Dictyoglomus]ACK41480.1 OstA family protein [Dictyoglomus turgidum DSM 6724]PNV79157.1 MAG: LPS export ABC transporter periplasmic protein LptC [Dictyoglomus turgidum]HBU31869.1 LPS export ABC transporter periplasmic protein LptC [Dictyoglomus sp.]
MKRLICILMIAILIMTSAFSQTKNPVKITAQKISYDYGKKTTRAEGNVVVIYKPGQDDETRITATLVFYNQDTNVVEAPGKVNISQRDLSIVGEDLKVDLKKETLELKKNVNMVLQRKVDNKVEITKLFSQSVVYSLKNKTGNMIGGVRIEREDLTVSANSADFDTDKEIYTFVDNVKMMDKDKNEINCKRLVVYVKDKVVVAEGNIDTTFYVTE